MGALIVNVTGELMPYRPPGANCDATAVYVPFASEGVTCVDHLPELSTVALSVRTTDPDVLAPP